MLKVNMTNDCLTLNAVREFSSEASFKGFFFVSDSKDDETKKMKPRFVMMCFILLVIFPYL